MSTYADIYKSLVADQPCSCCGAEGVELHHPREGQGMAQRASDWLVIPLCPDCHRGAFGIHGNKNMMKIKKLTEMDLLAQTIERIFTAKMMEALRDSRH